MSIQPIGFITVGLALTCLFFEYRVMLIVLVSFCVFGSAAAMFIGGANIPPGHLFLGAVVLVTLARKKQCAALLRALHPDRAGFWLLCFVAYGVTTAFFFPRAMAGLTQIIPLGTSEFDSTGFTVPLGPISSNFTQSVYTVSSFLIFTIIVSAASTAQGFRLAVAAATAYVGANAFFGLLDVLTYLTNTQSLLDFMRNARYALHTDTEVQGMKRIAGSFAEASSFARSSLGALGFVGTLWLCVHKSRLTGILTVTTILLAGLSTSSTALVGIPLVIAVLYMTAVSRSGTSRRSANSSIIALAVPLVLVLTLVIIVSSPTASTAVMDYLDLVVFSKGTSNSGIERSSWNVVALQNFFDSYGLGVGLGTVRTSSVAAALIAGVGVIGTALYLIFLGLAFFQNPGAKGMFVHDARTAARNGCIGLLIGDLLVGSTVDQGLFFFVLAGLAASRTERETGAVRSIQPMGAPT